MEWKKEKWEDLQSNFCSVGQSQLEKFRSLMNSGRGAVRFDKYFIKRSLERAISDQDVKEVLEYGWVVEWNKTVKSTYVIVFGYREWQRSLKQLGLHKKYYQKNDKEMKIWKCSFNWKKKYYMLILTSKSSWKFDKNEIPNNTK